jgi:acetoacetyl-CoA synthetase
MTDQSPLWQPSPSASRVEHHRLHARHRMQRWNSRCARITQRCTLVGREPGEFWVAVWDFCGVIGDRGDACCSTRTACPARAGFRTPA